MLNPASGDLNMHRIRCRIARTRFGGPGGPGGKGSCGQRLISGCARNHLSLTVRVKIITGSLVIIENLFPQNDRYRYRLEIRMNSFNYHYRYRLGVCSHPFTSIDSQLLS